MPKTARLSSTPLLLLALFAFTGCTGPDDPAPSGTPTASAALTGHVGWWRRRSTGGTSGSGGRSTSSGGNGAADSGAGGGGGSVGAAAGDAGTGTGGSSVSGGGAAGSAVTATGGAPGAGGTTAVTAPTSNPGQACAAEPLRSSGNIYYVCDCQSGAANSCVPGNDANPGTSASAPLRSFTKAASVFTGMNAGDTVALCRGGRWNITSGEGFANPACSKTNTCDLRDYVPPSATGSEGMPSIWINGGSDGATIMSFSHLPAHHEGLRVLNLDLHGTGNDTGLFFWNETTDVDLCDLAMDGFNVSVAMSGGDAPTYGTPANIVLRGSRITNNTNIGYIAVCDHCSVEDNFFDNNGVVNATTHSVYFASQVWNVNGAYVVHETVGMHLSRNEIHHSAIQCNGSPVVVHGRHRDVVIENNIVDAVKASDGCWGPGVGCGGYPYGCWFRNTIIRGNTIRNLGNTGTNSNNCVGCLIENNFITMSMDGDGINLGGDTPRPASEYTQSDGQPDDPTSNVTVRNNTIYFTGAAASGRGISISSGTGDRVENNATAFAATSVGPSDNLCLELPANASAVALVDYNVCKIPSGAHWVMNDSDYVGMSLQAWQAATGFDQHSKAADPMFTSAPGNCSPVSTSPLVNAGDPANSPAVDLNGKTRDAQPDIGAFEY